MRDRAYLDFVRDRVVAYVRAHPPTGPLLTESKPRPVAERCERGHAEWVPIAGGKRRCRACARDRKRAHRAQGLPT